MSLQYVLLGNDSFDLENLKYCSYPFIEGFYKIIFRFKFKLIYLIILVNFPDFNL